MPIYEQIEVEQRQPRTGFDWGFFFALFWVPLLITLVLKFVGHISVWANAPWIVGV